MLIRGDSTRQLLPVIERTSRGKMVMHIFQFSSTLLENTVVSLKLTGHIRVRNEINKHPDDKVFHQKL